MTSRDENQPPPTQALPEQWREIAVEHARRGPRHAVALAAVLEASFGAPWEEEMRQEAGALASWLRTTAAASDPGTP